MWQRCLSRALISVVLLSAVAAIAQLVSRPPHAAVATPGRSPVSALALAARSTNRLEVAALGPPAVPAGAPGPAGAPAAPPPGPAVAPTPVAPDGPTPTTVTVAPVAPLAGPAPAATAKPAAVPVPVPVPVIPAGSARAATALQVALSELGRPYRYGSLGPRAFDCSGLVLFAFRAAGLELPHSAAAQFHSGAHVARKDLQPGDLIFWNGLGHVGIYVGGGNMVHAPQTGGVVSITSIDQGTFAGAVRP